MKDNVSPTPLRYMDRWFAYLDLLGFSSMVKGDHIEYVLPLYEDVLDAIERKAGPKKAHGVSHSWFSDTFIIFSRGGSDREFAFVEQATRLFFQSLILQGIPVRGSITFGPLYSQQQKNIFLGEALIDAYEYGEKQNWLGLVLTPRVSSRLQGGELAVTRRAHYRKVDAPGIITHPAPDDVYAFAFNNMQINWGNPYMKAVEAMRQQAPANCMAKYENTLAFIRKHNQGNP